MGNIFDKNGSATKLQNIINTSYLRNFYDANTGDMILQSFQKIIKEI